MERLPITSFRTDGGTRPCARLRAMAPDAIAFWRELIDEVADAA